MSALDFPPLWALLFGIASWLLAQFIPLAEFELGRLWMVIVILALALVIWAIVTFRMHKTPVEPRQVPTALLRTGPFRINRNPMYTALMLLLLAFAIWLGALSAFAPVVVFPFLITRRFILDEEATLRETFPDEADSYIARTRRW